MKTVDINVQLSTSRTAYCVYLVADIYVDGTLEQADAITIIINELPAGAPEVLTLHTLSDIPCDAVVSLENVYFAWAANAGCSGTCDDYVSSKCTIEGTVSPPSLLSVTQSSDSPWCGESVNVDAAIQDDTGIGVVRLYYYPPGDAGSPSMIEMALIAGTVTNGTWRTVSPIPAQFGGTQITLWVWAEDTDGNVASSVPHVKTWSNPDCTITIRDSQGDLVEPPSGHVCAGSSGNTASIVAWPGATYSWSIANGTITSALPYTNEITWTAGAWQSSPTTVSITLSEGVYCSCTGSVDVPVLDCCIEPAVTVDPVSQLCVCAGSSVAFDVTATGSEPLSYQWRRDGVDLPGETASTLTIDPVDAGDAGAYDCVVQNACGTATSAGADLTVDTTPPNIDIPASGQTVECDGAGNVAQLNAWLSSHGGAAASDTCGGVTWSNDFAGLSDECGATGSATVTFTATDDCSNASTTTATFTIEDTTPPLITTEASGQTVECDGAGNTVALNAWLDSHGGAAASDVCCDTPVTWTHDYAGLSDECGATGSATVTFTATDCCGRTATTSATFTIEDTTPPSIDTEASDDTVECDGAGNVAELNAWLSSHGGAVASDICCDTPVTWTHDYAGLSDECGATGSATVTFTATDCCGRTATTSATFTIEDTTPPAITTQASGQSVECDGAGNTVALNAWLDSHGGAVASDICCDTPVTWTHDYAGLSDECGAIGSATVTFTATDCCGRTATTSATFTIEDTTPPSIDTPASGEIVECDGAGNVAQLNAWLDGHGGAAASDICCDTPVTWTHDFAGLSDECGATASATVTFTATDCCGRTATTIATFTIEDTTPPAITTQASGQTVECDGAGNVAQLNAWLDSHGGAVASDVCCDTPVTWTHDFTGLSDACGATGSATVTFTATDCCGQTATTSATFTIEDTTPPSIDTEASGQTVECDGAGNVAQLNAWLDSHGGAVASDICCDTPVTWTHDYAGLSDECGATGSATVTFTATDCCGRTATTSATFTIEDTTPPSIDTEASDDTVECDGAGNVAELNAWLSSHGGAVASDVCCDTPVTWTHDFTGLSDECGATGSATVTFTATDCCGRTATTSATFTIEDTTPPLITTEASGQTVECDGAGNTVALNGWLDSHGGAAASDVCCDTPVTWTHDFTSLSDECGATGSATVTFTATDCCGQTATTSATFTIEDTTPPAIDTPASGETVECDGAGNTVALNEWLDSHGGAAASGVCCDTPVTWTHDFMSLSDECGATGSATVTFTATDCCGRTATTSATFTIQDTTPPSITCPSDIETCNDEGLCSKALDPGTPTATDTCDSSPTTAGSRSDGLSLSDRYPCGETTITWSAEDECGRSASCIQTIIVNDCEPPVISWSPLPWTPWMSVMLHSWAIALHELGIEGVLVSDAIPKQISWESSSSLGFQPFACRASPLGLCLISEPAMRGDAI